MQPFSKNKIKEMLINQQKKLVIEYVYLYNIKGAEFGDEFALGFLKENSGEEMRGCDTPGRFVTDVCDRNFHGAMSNFSKIGEEGTKNGKTKDSYSFESL